jgi:two-component system sensor histidine kinase KdpD
MTVPRRSIANPLAGDLACAGLAGAVALFAAEVAQTGLGVTRFGLVFLATVTWAASLRGTRAAIIAALINVVAYKFYLDLRTQEQTTTIEDMMNLVIFLVVALITGTLAGRVRDEAERARQHARSMEMLFNTSRKISEGNDADVWGFVTEAVAAASGGRAFALDESGALRAHSGVAPPDKATLQFGRSIVEREDGQGSDYDGKWFGRTVPDRRPYEGALLWECVKEGTKTDEFVKVVTDLTAASITRARADHERIRVEAAEEAGKLREALLSSISHDFRSPLAAIIGSATSLLEYGEKFGKATRRDLLLNIQDEGEKLNQFVTGLLNMSRLQAGVIRPAKQPVGIVELVSEVAERLARHRGQVPPIRVESECQVLADPLLLRQAIYNVLDNATKYAASAEGIHVDCVEHLDRTEILIADHGPGLPQEDQFKVFSNFYYARTSGHTKGTGLGLSITRGFIEAMGGSVQARDRRDGQCGLEIVMSLPR